MPYHKALDAATENWKGAEKNRIVEIGNWLLLRRQWNNRSGIRMEDLLHPKELKKKLENMFRW